MRKALLLTDGSVDRALSLRQWLETQSEPINLTVVYALSLPTPDDQPLKVVTYREAKRLASEELNRWLTFLPQAGTSPTAPHRFAQLHTEILLGEPELVLTIHLLIRRYDYSLLDASQHNVAATFLLCQHQISTQLWCLSESEFAFFTHPTYFLIAYRLYELLTDYSHTNYLPFRSYPHRCHYRQHCAKQSINR